MRTLALLAGLVLLAFTLADVAVTLTQPGTGLGGRRRAARLRAVVRAVLRVGRPGARTPALGWAMAAAVMGGWLTGAWVGWGLVFCGAEAAVVTADGTPAPLWARFHFAGSALATLGVAPYEPGAPAWAFVTDATAFSGFALVSAVVAFTAQAVAAVAARAAWTARLRLLGADADAVSASLASERDALVPLSGELADVAAAHRVAPFLLDVDGVARHDSFACALEDLSRGLETVPAPHRRRAERAIEQVLDAHPVHDVAASHPLDRRLDVYLRDLGWSRSDDDSSALQDA